MLEEKLEPRNGVDDFRWLSEIMMWASFSAESKKWFAERWSRFIRNLLDWMSGAFIEESAIILKLFEAYGMVYRDFFFKEGNEVIIRKLVDSWIEDWNIRIIQGQFQHVLNENDIDRYETKLYNLVTKLYGQFIIDTTETDVSTVVKRCMEEHDWQAEMEKQNKNYYRREDGYMKELSQDLRRDMAEEGEIIQLFQ